MGKALSQLTSQKDEDKPILPDNPATASKAANYLSTGSSKPAHSCVPYDKTASTSFVTCPTCQGSGEIPQGEQPKALEYPRNKGAIQTCPSAPPGVGRPLLRSLWLAKKNYPGPAVVLLPSS